MNKKTEYIRKLHVSNIGIFDNLEIEFSPDVNIIIGANGTGKTSILKCLTYCLSHYNLQFSRFRKNAEFWIDFQSNESISRVGATNVVDVDQNYRQFNAENWGRVPHEEVDNVYSLLEQIIPYNLFAIGAHRYFDYKNMAGMQRESKGSERRNYYRHQNSSFLQTPSLPEIKQWMINRYFIIEKDWAEIENSNWQRIISLLPEIAPANQKFQFERIERDLEPIFSINNKECYLEELSGGFKSILSIIFSIIDWCEGINDGESALIQQANGTVLIDEIDAHLHPEWQQTIVKSLKKIFPKIQFILTTHSPYVISSASQNEIIKIPIHDGNLKVSPFEQSFQGWQIDNILHDLMGVTNKDELGTEIILSEIENSLRDKDRNKFETELTKLKELLHPNDPIIKVYEIKKSNLFL